MMFYDLITPPCDVIRPPSNAALTFFRATAVAGNRWQIATSRDRGAPPLPSITVAPRNNKSSMLAPLPTPRIVGDRLRPSP